MRENALQFIVAHELDGKYNKDQILVVEDDTSWLIVGFG